jgi:hypothetical protein
LEQSGTWFVLNSLQPLAQRVQQLEDAGIDDEPRKLLRWTQTQVQGLSKSEAADSRVPQFAQCTQRLIEAALALGAEDYAAAAAQGAAAAQHVQDLDPNAAFEGFLKYACVVSGPFIQAEAEFWRGNHGAVDRAVASAMASQAKYQSGNIDDRRTLTFARMIQALSLARLGREADSRALIAPEVSFERGLAAINRGDITLNLERAQVLYAAAQTDSAHRAVLKREARALVDTLPPEFARLRSTQRWRALIRRD